MVTYIYIGKCSDGKYWLIQGKWIKYVEIIRDDRGRTKRVMKNFAKIDEVLNNQELMNKLPREVAEKVQELAQSNGDEENGKEKREKITPPDFVYLRDKIEHLFVTRLYGMVDIKPPKPEEAKINYDKVLQNVGRDLVRIFNELECSRFITEDGTPMYKDDKDPCRRDPDSELRQRYRICCEINCGVQYDIELKEGKPTLKILNVAFRLPNRNVVLYVIREKSRGGETYYMTKIMTLKELYDEAIRRIMWQEVTIRDCFMSLSKFIDDLMKNGKIDRELGESRLYFLKQYYAMFLEFTKKMREFITALVFNMLGKVPIIDHKPLDEYILTLDEYDNQRFMKLISCEIMSDDEKYINLLKYVMKEDMHEIKITGVEPKLKKALAQSLHRKRAEEQQKVAKRKTHINPQGQGRLSGDGKP